MFAIKVRSPHAPPEARMPHDHVAGVVRRYFAAFEAGDREAVEGLFTEDFTFSSPRDDHIGKATFFERCWPNSRKIESFVIENIFEQGNEAFVRYRARRAADGGEFRNTEFLVIEGDRIKEIDVYFGRDL